MRMWMINPQLMCDKHLLGEHSEIHKFRHMFEKGYKLGKRIAYPAQIVPGFMYTRHYLLAKEMIERGMKHKSPYEQPSLSKYSRNERWPEIDLEHNIADLKARCPQCKQRMETL